jgi:hypothetical protein
MYHVSTLLPFKKNDIQQIERKRHIGNDVVNIVFLEGNAQFDPSTIKSCFTHVFITVRSNADSSEYSISVARHQDVPSFGPHFYENSTTLSSLDLREFLLSKMINGENASYRAPSFSKLHKKARKTMIDAIMKKMDDDVSIKKRGLMRMFSLKKASSSSVTIFNE